MANREKSRLVEQIRAAETLETLQKIIRYVHHLRRIGKLYTQLIAEGNRVDAGFHSRAAKGGAA